MSSNYKKTIVIGMDYSEFLGGITEINRKMGLLDAEFKRATAEAALYGDETGKLEAKQETLTQKIELQNKKIEEATKAYDKAVSASGYMSKAADQADKALLNERTTLLNLQKALNDTESELEAMANKSEDAENKMGELADQTDKANKKIEEAKEKSESFGDAIRGVADFLGLSANPAVEAFASKFDGVDKNVGNAVLTIGTMVTTLGNLTLKTAENAKEITNVSQRMGMTTKEYQEWDYIMQRVGSDAESMTGDIAALAEKAVDATDKTSETAKTFRILGVNVRDSHGAMKSQNEIFGDVIRGLQNMEDVTTRNAIATDLLSTTGENLGPVLNMTAKELASLRKEANDTGYVMSGKTLDGFEDLNKAMAEFDGVTTGLSQSFAVALLPMLTALFSAISAIPTPVLQMIITLTGIIVSMVAISKAVESTVGGFGKFTKFLDTVDTKTLKTTAIVLGVVAALLALAAIIAVIMGRGSDLERTMDGVGRSVGNINKGLQGQQGTTPHYASGTDYAPGGDAWVGEHGPERVRLPRGARVIPAEESNRTSGGDRYIIYATIDAKNIKDWTDVVNFMQQTKPAARAGRSVL